MKILFDIGHPAHVHLFRNSIVQLKSLGHSIKVTSRDKEVTYELLNYYGIDYEPIGRNQKSLLKKAFALLYIDYKLYGVARHFKPDVLIGVHNPYISHVSFLLRRTSIIFTDTEHAKLASVLTFPFSSIICTPSSFKKKLGSKQRVYNGYHELAYLHPRYFSPDPQVLEDLGVASDERFSVLRFVSWNASHDVNIQGIELDDKRKLVDLLSRYGRVFVSSESKLPIEFNPYLIRVHPSRIHNLLYYASIYVGEGGTMATEAALLGTPSIYISRLAGTMGNFEELEYEFGLLKSFTNVSLALNEISNILESEDSINNWQEKRKELLNRKVDTTRFIVDLVSNISQVTRA